MIKLMLSRNLRPNQKNLALEVSAGKSLFNLPDIKMRVNWQ